MVPSSFPCPRAAAASIAEASASAAAVESDEARIASCGRAGPPPKQLLLQAARCFLQEESSSRAAATTAPAASSVSERERLSPAVLFCVFCVLFKSVEKEGERGKKKG